MARRYQQRRLPPPKPPPVKWQPTKISTANEKKIYSIKNGKVLAVSLDNVDSLKKSVSDVTTKGKFYRIEMPESLLKKQTEPQTKLWYYDKRNYQQRPSSAPHNPVYSENYSLKEESIVIPDDTLVKTPVPNTEPIAVQEESKKPEEKASEFRKADEKETLPLISQPAQVAKKDEGKFTEPEATVLPPIVKSNSKSLYTLQSIDKSFRKYRF